MKLERLLSQVRMMRRSIAEQLAVCTDPNTKFTLGEQLQRKTTLLVLLLDERCEALEKELAAERLKARYKAS